MKKMYQVNRKRTGGFTLLEVLVVVVIVGILGAIAAPGWLGFLTRQKMNAVNSDLLNVINNAQDDAIQQKMNRRVVFSGTGDSPSATVFYADPAGNLTQLHSHSLGTDAEALQLSALEPDTDGVLIPVTGTAAIQFDGKGRASNIGATGLPYVIKVEHQSPDFRVSSKCVIITTLLGGLRSSQGETCDNFSAQ